MQALLASLLGLETPTSLPFGRTMVAINLDGTVDGQYTFPCP